MKNKVKSILILSLSTLLSLPLSQVSALESNNNDELNTIVQLVKEDLNDQNTDILTELTNQLENYENLLLLENDEIKQEQLNQLIIDTKIIIDDFKQSQSNNTRAIIQVPFATEVAAVIAYFNSKGYKLSAELLTHARNNKTLNSSYKPYYGYHVISSPVFRALASGTSTSGSATFPNNSSNVRITDCYYAIHQFTYTKSSSKSNIVNIRDRYDFARGDYSGLAGIAIDAMYNAQQFGTIKPFYTTISCSDD